MTTTVFVTNITGKIPILCILTVSIVNAKFDTLLKLKNCSFPTNLHPDEDAAVSLDEGKLQPWQAASGLTIAIDDATVKSGSHYGKFCGMFLSKVAQKILFEKFLDPHR